MFPFITTGRCPLGHFCNWLANRHRNPIVVLSFAFSDPGDFGHFESSPCAPALPKQSFHQCPSPDGDGAFFLDVHGKRMRPRPWVISIESPERSSSRGLNPQNGSIDPVEVVLAPLFSALPCRAWLGCWKYGRTRARIVAWSRRRPSGTAHACGRLGTWCVHPWRTMPQGGFVGVGSESTTFTRRSSLATRVPRETLPRICRAAVSTRPVLRQSACLCRLRLESHHKRSLSPSPLRRTWGQRLLRWWDSSSYPSVGH